MSTDIPFPISLLARCNSEIDKVRRISNLNHSLWQELDNFIAQVRNNIAWPKYVFMPFDLWPRFLEKYLNLPEMSYDLNHSKLKEMAYSLSCGAAWRPMQNIVSFDSRVEFEIKRMKLPKKMHSSILLRFPAWCVYFDICVRINGDEYSGFFAQLDSDKDSNSMVLAFQKPGQNMQRISFAIGDHSLAESFSEIDHRNDPGIVQIINFVIYLCAYGLIDSKDYSGFAKSWPQPRKTKKGWRIFPPDKPNRHVLGTAFGEKIRREGEKSQSRRAYWHHLWKEAASKKILSVQWMPPVFTR